MNTFDLVIKKLDEEHLKASINSASSGDHTWQTITWLDESKDECFIFQDDIAVESNRLAWFQSSKHDKHLLKVYDNEVPFSWTPITYNPVFGCTCWLLEWYKNHLLFIYQEKHDVYICSVAEGAVKYFSFPGVEISRNGDIIAYDSYMGRLAGKVRLIKIPELIELEPISKAEAAERGLLPKGLGEPGNVLALK